MKKRFPYRSAVVLCNGGCRANIKEDPACVYGCVACGRCIELCPMGAIELNAVGVAEVDPERCIACGKCVRECPRGVITVHECANPIVVRCSNADVGAQARKVCQVSCIGCGLCVKRCPAGAIRVVDNHAVIDESLCLSCGACAVACPRGAISDLRGILTI